MCEQAPSAPPFLLIASPELRDPNFRHAVVLILSHGTSGSFGLVLNRPMAKTVAEVLPDVDPRGAKIPLFEGGPVRSDALQFLGLAPLAPAPNLDSLEALLQLFPEAEGIRAYVGHAGWGEGQLAQELEERAWFVAPLSPAHLSSVPAARLWPTTLPELGGRYVWMALQAADPHDN